MVIYNVNHCVEYMFTVYLVNVVDRQNHQLVENYIYHKCNKLPVRSMKHKTLDRFICNFSVYWCLYIFLIFGNVGWLIEGGYCVLCMLLFGVIMSHEGRQPLLRGTSVCGFYVIRICRI